jgi:hypothetical protein
VTNINDSAIHFYTLVIKYDAIGKLYNRVRPMYGEDVKIPYAYLYP